MTIGSEQGFKIAYNQIPYHVLYKTQDNIFCESLSLDLEVNKPWLLTLLSFKAIWNDMQQSTP